MARQEEGNVDSGSLQHGKTGRGKPGPRTILLASVALLVIIGVAWSLSPLSPFRDGTPPLPPTQQSDFPPPPTAVARDNRPTAVPTIIYTADGVDGPHVTGITAGPGMASYDLAGRVPIAISFSPDVDLATTQIDLRVAGPDANALGGVTGKLSANTLVFTPETTLAPSSVYTVSVSSSNNGLAQPALATFRTAPAPAILRTLPAPDASEVTTDTVVTLQFNRPLIPLTSLDAQPDVSQWVSISPAVEGRFVWLGTSTLGFRATSGFRPSTTYRVAVKADLPDADGVTLGEARQWSFTTIRPAVVGVSPYNGADSVALDTAIIVRFNQSMEHGSVERAFRLEPASQGTFSWNSSSDVVTYTLGSLLPFATTARASFDGPLQPASGDATTLSSDSGSWSFGTVGQTVVNYTNPAKEQDNPPGSYLYLNFNNALAAGQNVGAFLTIDPVPQGYKNILTLSDDAMSAYTDTVRFLPNTTYSFSLREGLKDRYGAPVAVSNWTAKIGPLPPGLDIKGSSFRPVPAGQVTRLQIEAANLAEFTVRLYKLSAADMRKLVMPENYDYQKYVPSGQRVREWRVTVQGAADVAQTLWPAISPDEANENLPAGFWVVEVTAPAPSYMGDTPLRDYVALVSGKTVLTAKQDGENLFVWSADLLTGKPAAGVPLRIEGWLEGQGTKQQSATTGNDGILRTTTNFGEGWRNAIFVEREGDAAFVWADWSGQIGPWAFGLNGTYGISAYQSAIYTDRPIYRPDQTVYFRGIMRADDDAQYSLPGANLTGTIKATSYNSDRPTYEGTVKFGPDGSFSGEFKLPADAPTGSYNLTFTPPNAAQNNYYGGTSVSFSVEEYRKPEFQVSVTTNKPAVINGEPLSATVNAGYYFGGPLSNVTTTVSLQASPYYFSWSDPATDESYSFGIYDWDYWTPRPEGTVWQDVRQVRTDANGNAVVDITGLITTTDRSKVSTVEGQVLDLNNQTVANRTTAIIHQGQYYVGLHTDSYVATAGEAFTLTLRTVAPDEADASGGRIAPNREVRLRFYKSEWSAIPLSTGGSSWQQNDVLAGEQTVSTGADGRAVTLFTPADAGYYRVDAESTDAAGHVIKSSTRFWVSGSGSRYVPWNWSNPNTITMVADKEEYKVGDTARILVTSPFSQATGLLTVERGHVRRYSIVNLQGSAPTVEVKLEAGDLPNVFIGLTLLGPAEMNLLAAGTPADQIGRIAMRQGYVGLSLDTLGYEMQVSVEPQASTYEPGDDATVMVRTRDQNGNPVAGNVSLAVVDEAIFAMAEDNAPDLHSTFYGERGLGVSTGNSFTSGEYGPFPSNNGAMPPNVGARDAAGGATESDSAFALPAATSSPAMAEQDQKALNNTAPDPASVRVDFRDTAYWTANVATDSSGTATVQVPLPDNLTTWRLTARGGSTDAQLLVGAASEAMTVTKSLLLRPVAPRFLTSGDIVYPQAIIHNNTANELTVLATVEITGAAAYNMNVSIERELKIAAGGEEVVTWGAEVGAGDSVGLRFWVRATAGLPPGKTSLEDAVLVTIPVNPAVAPEAVATSGEVSGTEARETLFLPYGINPTLGQLTIDLSPSLAAGTVAGLEYVAENKYDGTEQIVSRMLPLVTLQKVFADQGQKAPLADQTPAIVARSLARLTALQRGDGGWGWWDITATSDPFITAYVMQGLTAARDAGYSVDNTVFDRGAGRLGEFVAATNVPGIDERSNLDLTAYEVYALSLARPGNSVEQTRDAATRLLDQQARMSTHALGWAALALANMGRTDEARTTLDTLAASAKQTSTLAHWEEDYTSYYTLATDARATALALEALVRLDPENGLVQKSVRWLMSRRVAGHWQSTQETSIVLVAMAHYIAQSKELEANYDWQVSLFGSAIGNGAANSSTLTQTTTLIAPVSSLPQNVGGPLVISRSNDSGKLYYSASLGYFLPGGSPARSEGLSIARTYYLAPEGGGTASNVPVHTARAGDLLKVVLTVVVPETSYYLAVEDPLPAGLEAVNGSLLTSAGSEKPTYPNGTPAAQAASSEGGKMAGDYGYSPWYYRWGPFQQVEMRDDRVALFGDYAAPGTYVFEYFARATTPGIYMNLPAEAKLQYFPDVFGRSDGGQFTVEAR